MSQLSAQSIRRLCEATPPLITPFSPMKEIINGKSYGLGPASYDVRIAQPLTLYPIRGSAGSHSGLASTVERFNIPYNVAGYIYDKSSNARVLVTSLSPLFDPGWRGYATLELANLGDTIVHFERGDPICQVVFHWLDEPTDRPYAGKYQDQPARPVRAIYEK